MSKKKDIEKLTAELKSSRNGEVYYATKYDHWKEQATVNRIGNFQLAESYLNLELYCEGLKEELLRYQTFFYGNEAYKERASSSMLNQLFPSLPMRPQLVSSLYFAAEDREDVRVKQIIKAMYRVSETSVVEGTVDDVKGKRLVKLSLSKAHKNRIRGLVDRKKAHMNLVVRH